MTWWVHEGISNKFLAAYDKWNFKTQISSIFHFDRAGDGQMAHVLDVNAKMSKVPLGTVKSRAVYRSTIQFLTIFGALLTKTCYYPRRATIAKYKFMG